MKQKNVLNCIAGFLLSLCVASAIAESVRITNGEWPPFTSSKFQQGGFLSRVVAEAFALEGVTVEYGFFPWKRAYENAKNGSWDGSIAWAPTPDHLQDFYLSEPVVVVDKAFFHLTSTAFNWKTIDDLRSLRLGGTAGYSYGTEWDQAVKNGTIKVDEVPTDEQNIRKLLVKRFDVMPMEVDVAQYLIKTLLTQEEAAKITYHPKLVVQTPICFALSRSLSKSPELMARFNKGLRRLKESGRYAELMNEFHQNNRAANKPDAASVPAKNR